MQELSRSNLENIHRHVLRILEEIGIEVGHDKLLEVLAASGAKIDKAVRRARFPRQLVEAFIAECPKYDPAHCPPRLVTRASFFWGKYEDPDTGQLGPINERRIREYFTLAKSLPNVNGCFMTGCPWAPKPEESPLYERFYCWKYGVQPSGILYPLDMAPRLKALYEAYMALKGRTLPEVFQGSIFLMSPLRLSAEEAAQFVWWWEQGCWVEIAHMTTAGLSAPVTPAGLAAMNIAEEIALSLLRKACYGRVALFLNAMVACVDMRTLTRPGGRPEMAIGNRIIAAMAGFYGVDAFLQSGLTDAKRSSCEAGAQKAMTTLAALFTGAQTLLETGLLSLDEVFSPIQMILDHELAGALHRFLLPIDCSDEAIGFAAMAEAGPGGVFTGLPHTGAHYREAIWEPGVWSRNMLGAWEQDGRLIDIDYARRMYHAIMDNERSIEELTPVEQETLLAVIKSG